MKKTLDNRSVLIVGFGKASPTVTLVVYDNHIFTWDEAVEYLLKAEGGNKDMVETTLAFLPSEQHLWIQSQARKDGVIGVNEWQKQTEEEIRHQVQVAWDEEYGVIIFRNMETQEYFFSTEHGQVSPSGFVTTNFYLPMEVKPRDSHPDGILVTREDIVKIFHSDDTEIPNPNPLYQG